jgi:hypothetical protein
MLKTRLTLNRETLRNLAAPNDTLRGVAGGIISTPITQCAASLCVMTCPALCKETQSVRVACTE